MVFRIGYFYLIKRSVNRRNKYLELVGKRNVGVEVDSFETFLSL